MKLISKWLIPLLLAAMVLTSCSGAGRPLPTPKISVTTVPEAKSNAQAYLTAWEKEDYVTMYNLLSTKSQAGLKQEDFSKIYQDSLTSLTSQSLKTEILHDSINITTAQVDYQSVFQTALFGEFTRTNQMNLTLENGTWKIVWDTGLILPELKGGNKLALDLRAQPRGNILDRKGEPIVAQSQAYALGIIPGQISTGQEGQLLYQLSQLTGKPTETIKALYENVGLDWYVPVGEATADDVNAKWNILTGLGGLVMTKFESRYYYDDGVAPQAVGYALGINKDQLDEYKRKGYLGDEKVGQAGLEKYADEALAGKPSASLYVTDPNGQIVTKLNQSDPKPAQNITTTLDRELQVGAQQAISGFRGAIVVMELETGRVLAMVSSPTIDPNLFEPTNRNNEGLDKILNEGDQPLLNRATQSGYPLGSVFKLVTMSAALESGLYTPDSSYYCDSYFKELAGEPLADWTVEKKLPPSGNLTLTQGLMRSCNPWFYHIGLDLFRQKGATFVSNMARGFGLGSATGIEQVAEDPGNIPDPKTDGDAVQLAIGQGETLVTPLQVARFVAAIGNGGTLYRPQIIENITSSTGVTTYTFTPQSTGTLPVKPETLSAVQVGMRLVVQANLGTAHYALSGLTIPIYGKTGTATNSTDKSHAWFVGYTQAGRKDKPDIAVVVIAENAGEGSEVAAPIFRRVIETYFYGKPIKLYPWESTLDVTRTPTLQYTLTPTITPIRPPTEQEPTPIPG